MKICMVLLVYAVLAQVAVAASTPPNPKAVAEVASGKRSEAHASWWGFDPEDATAALQSAIDSGTRKVVVDDMGAPWVTDKLTLAGNQQIVFKKGVVVQAKRGAFRGSEDCLFSAALKTNITLIGHGATLRMWKQDYADPARYKRAEWRHVLSFTSCTRVRVEGLTLADSGGDGIYLGVAKKGVPCSDVVIRKVTCLNNYRQGISVISARNLLIEDCALQNTGGTAPEAGIDFEPNEATEELVNCVMRNCISEGNKGDAYTAYLRPLRSDSKPISIRLENCRAVGGRHSVSFVAGNDSQTAATKGAMEFIKCRFERSRQAAISIGDKPATGARVRFAKCEIVSPAVNASNAAPIEFTSGADGVGTLGGVDFAGCTLRDSHDRLPMSFQDLSGGLGLKDITGTLTLLSAAKRTRYHLTPELLAQWMPFTSFKEFAQIDTKKWRWEPAFPELQPEVSQRNTARQRGTAEWLLWTEAGQRISFAVSVQPVGKVEVNPVPVSIISPSGKLTKLAAAAPGKETVYEVQATERGAARIICEAQSATAVVNSPLSRVCLYSPTGRFHLLGTTGQFWFRVPPGTVEFGIIVSGGGGTECVKAAMFNSANEKIQEKDNIGRAHQFLVKRAEGPDSLRRPLHADEIWSLSFDKPGTGVLEDFFVRLQGIPGLISPTRESVLKPAN